jgi:hypothetical protein
VGDDTADTAGTDEKNLVHGRPRGGKIGGRWQGFPGFGIESREKIF